MTDAQAKFEMAKILDRNVIPPSVLQSLISKVENKALMKGAGWGGKAKSLPPLLLY